MSDFPALSSVAARLREEMQANGVIPFRRFMEVALYEPVHGYYRRARDPFGKGGDFYTAEQMQPVFGILIAQLLRRLRADWPRPEEFAVWELGAGRGEMQPYLEPFGYTANDVGRGALPDKIRGVVFANEFFDALPVESCVWRAGAWHMRDVAWTEERFAWREGERARAEVAEYLARFCPENPEEGTVAEAAPEALVWIDELARRLEGDAVILDYGYTRRELMRFASGTLMSYRRHQAEDDVLATPGERDITAHVNFTALRERARERGMTELRFESMGRTLLDAGEQDQFAAALEAENETERTRRRLQLKSLLFGMGESFRTLVLRRGV